MNPHAQLENARKIRKIGTIGRRATLGLRAGAIALCLTALAVADAPSPATRPDTPAANLKTSPPADVAPAHAASAGITPAPVPRLAVVPEPRDVGGETAGIVQVANLIYAGTKTSKCFSDHFLIQAEQDSAISTSRRLTAVKLSSDELFQFPLVIMTGEGEFELPDQERRNLRKFVEGGGLLLASAGCSSPDWDRSFRSEMAKVFPEYPLTAIGMDHPVFHTVYDIAELQTIHGGAPHSLEGVTVNNRLGVLYSQDGLNDTAHTEGCCCCGGNEIQNDIKITVNILAYSLLY